MIQCSGPCDQGRKSCPTPQACGLQALEEDPPHQDIVRVVLGDLTIAVALAALVLIIIWSLA